MNTPLDELFTAYHRDVYAYLFSLCREAALSEELTSEVFLEAVRSVGRFRGDSDCKTWLFSIARHRWLAYLRKKGRQPHFDELSDLLADRQDGPEAAALYTALRERALQLLEHEPPRTRTVVGMRLDGYSFYEIGQSCGISESSARVIDFRAKQRLRAVLEQEGFL